MKVAQLQWQNHKEGGWETHFLDRITCRNLRGGIFPFVYFAVYLLKELPNKIDGFDYVPMLFSNQSPLEGQFSAMRSSGHDNAATYAGEITNKSVRQSNAAQMRSHTYSTEDCAKEGGIDITGNTTFTQYEKLSKKKSLTHGREREKQSQKKTFVSWSIFWESRYIRQLKTWETCTENEYSHYSKQFHWCIGWK